MKKKALITGITGQDGSYLSKFLVDEGYEVHGLVRHASTDNLKRLYQAFRVKHRSDLPLKLVVGDLLDPSALSTLREASDFEEIYNLAAQSHVGVSFSNPSYTSQVNFLGTLNSLELARSIGCRFYQASTSELYGSARPPQSELTPFEPRSPYAVSKLAAFWLTKNYREAYGLFACNGILFNHESLRRGEGFVTQKICQGFANIFLGEANVLELGNLNSCRDWGHASDYTRAMHMMINHHEPLDLVIATGKTASIRQFVEMVAQCIGFHIDWVGEGLAEKGVAVVRNGSIGSIVDGQTVVTVDQKYFRPAEVESLCGDASCAKKVLGWEPLFTLEQLVDEMVTNALGEIK